MSWTRMAKPPSMLEIVKAYLYLEELKKAQAKMLQFQHEQWMSFMFNGSGSKLLIEAYLPDPRRDAQVIP